jgi:hypothetical protein
MKSEASGNFSELCSSLSTPINDKSPSPSMSAKVCWHD